MSADELERAVRMVQSQKMEAIGEMSAGIVHDFNNIMMAVIGNLQLAMDDLGGNNSFLQEAFNEAIRASDLSRRILGFTRKSETGQQTIVDPVMKTLEAIKIAKLSLDKKIRVKTDFPDQRTMVSCEPNEFVQVILNLCLNAGQAMMPAGGEILISIQEAPGRSPGNERWIKISISDSGPGINHDLLAKIFDPYFTTKPRGQGTGLGLAVSKQIIQKNGGEIRVQTELNKGSCFSVLLAAIDYK